MATYGIWGNLNLYPWVRAIITLTLIENKLSPMDTRDSSKCWTTAARMECFGFFPQESGI